jgi:hypothetical protein
MIEFNPGEILYTFLGEHLIEFRLINHIDELRICGEDNDCTYTFFKKDCYNEKQRAINGMFKFLTGLKND